MAKSHSRSRSKSRSSRSRTTRRSKSSRSRSRSRSRNKNSKSSSRHHKSSRHHSSSKSPGTKTVSQGSRIPTTVASSSVLEACWKPVRHDPTNFDAWTHLLQCVENMDDSNSAKDAFDPFLEKFPYCFGYWRKYAEFYKKHNKFEEAIEVYERGVNAIPLSVDLWLAYINFYKECQNDAEDSRSKINQLYEKAVEACGLEFRSDKLWEDFIGWKNITGDFRGAMQIYDQMNCVPLLLYSAHFDKLQEFVNTYEPHEILSEVEFDELYKEIEEKLSENGQEIFVGDESTENGNENGNDDSGNDPKTLQLHKKYNDEALKLFRLAVLDKRRKVHLKTESQVSKRWSFEEAIKRPYFHVKPLERTQLRNWRHYLDFEIEQGEKERIVVLFERCLIACALYEDIWMRYARYMESVTPSDVRQIFKRACEVHLPHKASVHLMWAAFEEKQKNYDYARSVLTNYEMEHPGSVIVLLRRTGIEVRRTIDAARVEDPENPTIDFSLVCKEYEKMIAEAKSVKMATFFAIKYARFHEKIRKDHKMAEKIILDAAKRDVQNTQLHMVLVQMAFEQQPFEMDKVLEALDRALNSEIISEGDKLQFSQRKLELLEDFSDDVDKIQRHYEAHIKLYKNLGFSTSKKRPTVANNSHNDEKRQKVQVPITPTVVGGGGPVYASGSSGPYYDYGGYYNQQQQGGPAGGQAQATVLTYTPPGGFQPPQQPQTYGYYVSSNAAAH